MSDAIIFGFGFGLGLLACFVVVLLLIEAIKTVAERRKREKTMREFRRWTDWENSPEGKRQRAAEYDA